MGEAEIRIFLLMAVMLLGVFVTGCGEMAEAGDSSGAQPTATLMPPATPVEPKAPQASVDIMPSTPMPADTPVAAAAVSVPADEVGEVPAALILVRENHFEDCLEIAEETVESGIILGELRRTRPEVLTDRERFEWRQELGRLVTTPRIPLLYPCAALWSERITAGNSDKRNWDFADECVDELQLMKPYIRSGSGAYRYYEELLKLEYRLQSGAWRIMQGSYSDLSVGDKLALRAIGRWGRSSEEMVGALDIAFNGGCFAFYPQLFAGRWIPAYRQNDEGGVGISLNGFLGVYDGEVVFCMEQDSEGVVPGTNSEWSYVSETDEDDGYCAREGGG